MSWTVTEEPDLAVLVFHGENAPRRWMVEEWMRRDLSLRVFTDEAEARAWLDDAS